MFTKQFSRICDISGTSERIPARITCNSRHAILAYCSELKRENTSRDRKISFEIWRFELLEVTNHHTRETVLIKEMLELWEVEL